MRFLQEWFNKFDEHFFDDYFKDKNIKLTIEKFKGLHIDWEGWACIEDREIAINEECFSRLTPMGIRDVLLHETIHLFVAFTHPKGRKEWDDKCKAFKRMERDFQNLRKKEFEIVMCGE